MLYVSTGCVVVALEALVVVNWHAPAALTGASVVFEPFFVAIVTAFSYADRCGDLSNGAAWLRVLERAWAVVLIGLIFNLVAGLGMESIVTDDVVQKLLGTAVVVVAVSMIFADVHAMAVEDAEPWWWLVPRSFAASMALTWRGAMFARAVIVFTLATLVPFAASMLLEAGFDRAHVAFSALWANAVMVMLLLPIVQALCTFVYLDALGFEPKRPCGE
jgi:hypothetical protein